MIKNILNVFTDVEKQRTDNLLEGIDERYKRFGIQYNLSHKELSDFTKYLNQSEQYKYPEVLKYLDIPEVQAYRFNDILIQMLESLVKEMVRQGVVMLEINDKDGTCGKTELNLSVVVCNPSPGEQRITINKP